MSQKQIRPVLLGKSLLYEYLFFSYLMVVILAHRAYAHLTSDRCKLGWHLILADKYRIFTTIYPSIKSVVVEAAILTLAISTSIFVWNITIHGRVGQNLHVLIIKLRGNEV